MTGRSNASRSVASLVALPLALFVVSPGLRGQSQRDPTVPPPVPVAASSASAAARLPGADAGPMTVIVRDGQPYLVVGTRLFAQGQKLGEASIERIGETEIWLREGGVLRRVPRFSGVQRRDAALTGAPPECAAPATRPRQSGPGASPDRGSSEGCVPGKP